MIVENEDGKGSTSFRKGKAVDAELEGRAARMKLMAKMVREGKGPAPIEPDPNDPEGMNDDRAEWAATALKAFRRATHTEPKDALKDLLCNLAHWCDREGRRLGVSFDVELDRAMWSYREEAPNGKQFEGVEILGAVEGPEPGACEACHEPFEKQDIDGGRCTKCGTMIAAKGDRPEPEPEPGPLEVYNVAWECDYDATSALEAARKAWADMQAPGSIANTFTVSLYDAEGDLITSTEIDLNEIAAAEPEGSADDDRYKCQNCGKGWKLAELKEEIPDLMERWRLPEPMPAGECPECGALCHKVG